MIDPIGSDSDDELQADAISHADLISFRYDYDTDANKPRADHHAYRSRLSRSN